MNAHTSWRPLLPEQPHFEWHVRNRPSTLPHTFTSSSAPLHERDQIRRPVAPSSSGSARCMQIANSESRRYGVTKRSIQMRRTQKHLALLQS